MITGKIEENIQVIRIELNRIAGILNFNKKQTDKFVKQVESYVLEFGITSWEGIYSYVDGLLQPFDMK